MFIKILTDLLIIYIIVSYYINRNFLLIAIKSIKSKDYSSKYFILPGILFFISAPLSVPYLTYVFLKEESE